MAHTYLIGKTGSGKSTYSINTFLESIKRGEAGIFIDPHGTDVDTLMGLIPNKYISKTILFDPLDPEYYLTWNALKESDDKYLTASTLTDTVTDISGFHGAATAQMEMFLISVFVTLIETNRPISDALNLLDDPDDIGGNDVLVSFWCKYIKKTDKDKDIANNSTYNKFFRLLIDERIRRLFSQINGQFSLRDAVKDKILLVRLPQGRLGRKNVEMLGSFLISQLHLACLDRDTTIPYHIHISELHTFSPHAIVEMLSGLRKFNCHITVDHQNINQLRHGLFESLMTNCDTKVVFQVSPEDSLKLQPEMTNNDIYQSLHDLPPHTYRKFPWTRGDKDCETVPLEMTKPNTADRIRRHTRVNYCRSI